MTPEQLTAIKSIVTLFEESEIKLKEVEQFTQDLSIPSINELRYAGYHLAKAICYEETGDNNQLNCEIDKAKGHCKRAVYDAHEMGIIYVLEKIKLFNEQYTDHMSVVVEVMPNYSETVLLESSKASSCIADIKNSHRDNRDNFYTACEPYYTSLKNIVTQLSANKPLIDTIIDKNIKREKVETRRFIFSSCVTLLCAFLAALGIIVTLSE